MLEKGSKQVTKAYVKEIFASVQGEGLSVGEMQLFVRFCNCNLNCSYCDTSFKKDKKTAEYTEEELAKIILHSEIKMVSFTGGEPLTEVNFLRKLFPLIKPHKTIYLETNGTMTNALSSVIQYVDIVSADIKLKSVTKQENQFEVNDEFFNVAKEKKCFIKVVFADNIEKNEISEVVKIAEKYNLPIILQPVMVKNSFASDTKKLIEIYKIFYNLYPNTRLIPQVHKFLKII